MAGTVPVYACGPVTYEVSAAVTGGQVVAADASNGAKVHPVATATLAADVATVVGVATKDAVPAGTDQNTGGVLNLSPLPNYVAVAYDGIWNLKAAAAITFGQTVKAANLGQVTPWVSGTDAADLIIGRCVEPAGIASGAVGQIRLNLG